MGRKKKEYKCKVCGKIYYGYRTSGTCSIKCGLKAQMQAIKQLQSKKGKIYEKWRKNWSKATKKRTSRKHT